MTISYAVIGASRGIGLEFVRQLATRPDTIVFAVVRNKQKSTHLAAATATLHNVRVVEADVVNHKSVLQAAEEIGSVTGGKLDYLIHNAARMDPDTIFRGFDDYASMDELDADFIEAFKINALGVVHSISAFLPLLRAGPSKKIVIIGSVGGNPKIVYNVPIADMVAYGTTKAASLLITTKWALRLKDEGFVVVSLNPGLVDTTGTIGDSGDPVARAVLEKTAEELGPRGLVLQTPEQSVRAQLQIIDKLRVSDNGGFFNYDGESCL